MGGETDWFSTLLSFLEEPIGKFPDKRTGKNTRFSMRDVAFAAFSVFFTQSPSFLSHQQLLQLLDPVEPSTVFPVYRKVFSLLQKEGTIESYRSFANDLLVALDGTWFHSSEKVSCEQCNWQDHRNGKRTYITARLPR